MVTLSGRWLCHKSAAGFWHQSLFHRYRWRPYHVECTGSLLTSEVKRHRARLVLGWGTAWEDLRVLPASSIQQGQRSRAGEERGWGRRRRINSGMVLGSFPCLIGRWIQGPGGPPLKKYRTMLVFPLVCSPKENNNFQGINYCHLQYDCMRCF